MTEWTSGLPEGADDPVAPSDYPAGEENYTSEGRLKKKYYEAELQRLQEELVKLQYWIHERGLKVLDATAISLCRDSGLPVVVFDLFEEGNLERVLRGERLGTLIRS